MTRDKPKLVTVKQAAAELGLTPLTLRYFMASDELDLGLVLGDEKCRHRKFIIYRKKLDTIKKRMGLM